MSVDPFFDEERDHPIPGEPPKKSHISQPLSAHELAVIERAERRIRELTDATPGPWSVVSDDDGITVMAGDRSICDIIGDTIVDEANAAICAAGPDLLAAARLMMDDYQTSASHHPEHVGVALAAFEALRSAVAKAEGRTHD